MRSNDGLIADLAGSILDGEPVDWDAADSSAGAAERQLLPQLRLVATVATLCRSVPLAAAVDEAPLTDWGHLKVLEPIGRGAFGQVYRAWDTKLDREVALKLLPAAAARAGASSAIVEEGRRLGRVRHPNVVTIYGADRIGNRIGLWMELVRGRTLQEALQQGTAFSVPEAIAVAAELARAVAAVHDAGLIHRDIKPHNVMLSDQGRVVLMDFGTSRERAPGSAPELAGTPLYLAPELLRGAPPSVAGDIYSLGVLLFYLLTRSYPIHAASLHDLRLAHDQLERRDVRVARPDVPAKLARIIGRTLSAEPEHRHHSAADLANDLASCGRRSWLTTVAVAGTAAAAVAGLAWSGAAPGGLSPAGRSAMRAASTIEHPVIAVLPLKNLNADDDSDYVADGLTDEIVRNLAVIRGLEVRSLTSSFAFRDRPRNLREVGEELGANLVVEGSVLRSGNRIRINAQLIQVAGDVPLWAERFDRELKDIFAIQDEISRAIVNRLRLTLGKGQRRYDVNPEAYQLYLRARATVARRSHRPAMRAAELFEQVVAMDPSFAPAYAGLVNAYAAGSMDIESGLRPGPALASGISSEQAVELMRSAAERALQLDPLLPEAHAGIALLAARERDWTAADASFQRALALDPSLTGIHATYASSTLIPLGRLDDAERLLRAALRADPLSLEVGLALSNVLIMSGRYEEAIDRLQRLEAADPTFPYVDLHLTRALTFAGRLSEALPRWEVRENEPGRQHWVARAYVLAGRREWVERAAALHDHPYRLAVIHAALGNHDRALDALNRAADVLPQRVALLTVYPEMAALRGDPRFAAIRRKLGLP